ncbi:alpha/beta fold hydrolase [Mobilitalea sibirica]|uniref:Alpha/beta fold hydrolase n=1 Tax=Mobilitalea sibirica TaxID=1462919 RepID=A0A8J7HAZ4_9FIRM|nr:alpha/beta hydrolase [Mobilitalea sibirica]MBH1940496.1 alpha/beta fold hydrolase [Mobilitalea sibirica]
MSSTNYIKIKQKDGYITRLTHISNTKRPKASILILHGMAEHQKRYYNFAQHLVEQGFDVFLYDHRGHGTDKKLSELGYIAPNKGYQILIDDAIHVSQYIENNNRCSKFFLFGHSMGSLIARNVIQSYDKYNGVILMGTTHPPRLLSCSGLALASIIKGLKGPKHISPYMNNLMFGNKKYIRLSERTAFDWLSRSHPVVGAYIHDPYCGFICSASFYHDLIKLTSLAIKKTLIRMTKKDLPMFIISGEKDPVGGYGKEIKKLLSVYKKLEYSNITSKLYPDDRHELLNELNNDEVYSDILLWLSKRI